MKVGFVRQTCKVECFDRKGLGNLDEARLIFTDVVAAADVSAVILCFSIVIGLAVAIFLSLGSQASCVAKQIRPVFFK